MRTPKIEALYRMIDWLNARSTSPKLTKLGLDTSPLGNNPWLSGFIEADGNFHSDFTVNSEGIATRIRHYMRISQKALYSQNSDIPKENNSNREIMEKIKEFLDVKSVNEITRIRESFVEIAYEVRTSRKTSSEKLINYLSEYPLFSSKHQDFLAWAEIHKIRLSRAHKTIDGTSKLIFLKNSMNTLRTQFNWDSLARFYAG
jgi:LAGLIDADG DNA endonuclease family protein